MNPEPVASILARVVLSSFSPANSSARLAFITLASKAVPLSLVLVFPFKNSSVTNVHTA
jgi:hypothetical protein